jgi:hypothetical protein
MQYFSYSILAEQCSTPVANRADINSHSEALRNNSRVMQNLLFSGILQFFEATKHSATTHAMPYNFITPFISNVHVNKYCLPMLDYQ